MALGDWWVEGVVISRGEGFCVLIEEEEINGLEINRACHPFIVTATAAWQRFGSCELRAPLHGQWTIAGFSALLVKMVLWSPHGTSPMRRKKIAAHSKVCCYAMTSRGVVWSCQSYESFVRLPPVVPLGWCLGNVDLDSIYILIFVNDQRFSYHQHQFPEWNPSYRYHLTTYPPTMASKSVKACAN